MGVSGKFVRQSVVESVHLLQLNEEVLQCGVVTRQSDDEVQLTQFPVGILQIPCVMNLGVQSVVEEVQLPHDDETHFGWKGELQSMSFRHSTQIPN